MSYQLALCSRIVRTGDLTSVLHYGITDDDFTTAEAKSLWALVLSYYSRQETRGAILGEGVLKAWFQNMALHDDMASMPIDALCYEVRRERMAVMANSAVIKFCEEIGIPTANPMVPMAKLHAQLSGLMALGSTANADITLKVGMQNLLQELENAKRGINDARMSWPWQALEKVTFGLQKDDYIVFYGRPKSMKTWVLCYLISWAFEHEKKVLVYTKEMTPDNVYKRTLACICKLAYSELREAAAASAGKPLTHADEMKLHNMAQYIASNPEIGNQLIVLSGRDVPPGGDTVSWLNSKIDQYKPDIMFVDGIYLLSDQHKSTSDHTRVMNISRDLRSMVLGTKVPLISTMQANRKAAGHGDANLDEIAYSDALAQDATTAARVIADKNSPTISLLIGGSREYKLHGLRINGVPATDFSFHSELTEKDAEKAREADAEDKAKNESKNKKETVRKPKKNGPKSPEEQVADDLDTQVSMGKANGAFG